MRRRDLFKKNGMTVFLLIPLLTMTMPASVLPAWEDVLKEFRRAFRPAKDPAELQERRLRALEGLVGLDSPGVAEALLDAHIMLEKQILPLIEERRDYLEGKRRGKEYKQRLEVDPLRDLQEGIREKLSGLKDRASIEILVQQSLTNKKLGLTFRIDLAARAGETREASLEAIRFLLKKRKDPGSLLVGLTAARGLGRKAGSLDECVTACLGHEEAPVRESAASALAEMCLPESIVPLIDRLEEEEGRTKDRIAAALQILTRQSFGTSVHAWRRWIEKEGKPYLDGKVKLGGGEAARKVSSAPKYHEIPMDGESILYVIDISLYMRKTMTKPSRKAEAGEESRMSRARSELLLALGRLSPAKRFNIIAFAGSLKCYAPEMVLAKPKNIKLAQAWVKELDVEFGTQLYDALERAFFLAGKSPEDRYYNSSMDTLFVLTDGYPTKGNLNENFKMITPAVRRWNLLHRVTIHTIGLGDDIPKKRLKRFAQDNGGKFVHEVSGE